MMPLTPTQRAWADDQVGTDVEAVLNGTITKKSGTNGDYVMEVAGDAGAASFHLDTDDGAFAESHVGVVSSVKVEGTVTSVTLDEESGRVGLVVTADNGTITQWHVPDRSDAEIEAARPPEPTAAEVAAAEQAEADRQAEAEKVQDVDAKARLKGQLVAMLETDPELRAALKAAVA